MIVAEEERLQFNVKSLAIHTVVVSPLLWLSLTVHIEIALNYRSLTIGYNIYYTKLGILIPISFLTTKT